MEFFDIIILILLLLGGLTGAKNGFFKQSVVLIGTIFCFILAWFFKNPIANFLSYNLPFFKFNGLETLNIVLYQLIAFLLLLVLFTAILVVLIKITGIFEKILKLTIILGIPSKILGFIVGIIEMYVVLFVIFFFLNQPIFKYSVVTESNFAPVIVNSSPGLSNIVSNMNNAVKDTYKITKEYENTRNANKTNREIVDVLKKNRVIDQNYLDNLRKKGKINY